MLLNYLEYGIPLLLLGLGHDGEGFSLLLIKYLEYGIPFLLLGLGHDSEGFPLPVDLLLFLRLLTGRLRDECRHGRPPLDQHDGAAGNT
jgi:hypothetical protein